VQHAAALSASLESGSKSPCICTDFGENCDPDRSPIFWAPKSNNQHGRDSSHAVSCSRVGRDTMTSFCSLSHAVISGGWGGSSPGSNPPAEWEFAQDHVMLRPSQWSFAKCARGNSGLTITAAERLTMIPEMHTSRCRRGHNNCTKSSVHDSLIKRPRITELLQNPVLVALASDREACLSPPTRARHIHPALKISSLLIQSAGGFERSETSGSCALRKRRSVSVGTSSQCVAASRANRLNAHNLRGSPSLNSALSLLLFVLWPSGVRVTLCPVSKIEGLCQK
jgi:hypothetical protein